MYVLCVNESDIDLMFQCEGKQNLMAKNDYVSIRLNMDLWIIRLLNSEDGQLLCFII